MVGLDLEANKKGSMKLEKRVSKEKGIDQYVLYISHEEADAAFELMTPLEKGMIAEMRKSDQISSILKVLSLWASRIEEAKDHLGLVHVPEGGIKREG